MSGGFRALRARLVGRYCSLPGTSELGRERDPVWRCICCRTRSKGLSACTWYGRSKELWFTARRSGADSDFMCHLKELNFKLKKTIKKESTVKSLK